MFKLLLLIGSGLFLVVGFVVFEWSLIVICFLAIMAIFYFCAGYYNGLLEVKYQDGFVTKEAVDRMFGEDNKL